MPCWTFLWKWPKTVANTREIIFFYSLWHHKGLRAEQETNLFHSRFSYVVGQLVWHCKKKTAVKVSAPCSYGGKFKFMLAANFSFKYIINIIHVAEDPLLSPLEHPPIALIKILINYYIFESVIIFQMLNLMNFFFSLAVHHHWQAPQNITNSTS